jgi:hypothetical protein
LPSRWLHRFELKPDCWVSVPDDDTIHRGRFIKRKIESLWKPPSYYAHLHPGGHVLAIQRHLENTIFFRADIHQFFNSINLSRVTRSLKRILRSYKDARDCAVDSVVVKPEADSRSYILPFGFVQSVIISSLCLRDSALGKYLDVLKKAGFCVTVYVDDIIVSTKNDIEMAREAFKGIKDKAARSHFSLNREKTFEPCREITAFNIKISHGKMALHGDRLEKFREKISTPFADSTRNGIIEYVRSVCPEQADYLLTLSDT